MFDVGAELDVLILDEDIAHFIDVEMLGEAKFDFFVDDVTDAVAPVGDANADS